MAAAEIAVVRNGDHVSAQPLFVVRKMRPEVFRVFAVEGGERQCLPCQCRPVSVDDIPVQPGPPARLRTGPLIAGEGRECARIVVLLGHADHFAPHVTAKVLIDGVVVKPGCLGGTERTPQGIELLGRAGAQNIRKRRQVSDDLRRLACALRLGQCGRILGEERQDSEVRRVVRHHQEVQWAAETRRLAARRLHGFAFRETIGVVGREPGSQGERVAGEIRVHVRVAPIDVVRVRVVDVGRIRFGHRRSGEKPESEKQRRPCDIIDPCGPVWGVDHCFFIQNSEILQVQPDERLALDCCSMPRQVRAPLGICSVTNRRRSSVSAFTSPSGSNIAPIRTS